MGGGLVLMGWPQGVAQGTLGGRKAVGHVAFCPKLHPKRDQPESGPETRPQEADCLWGTERAAARALIQTLEAAGSRPFPAAPSPASSRAAVLALWANSAGPFYSSNTQVQVHVLIWALH